MVAEVVLTTGLAQDDCGGEDRVFSRDAILLIGHGSTRQPGAARPLLAHVDSIRATGLFGEVAAGVLLGEPSAADAFRSLTSQVIHIVPFFLEDGYFTRIAIPNLLMPLTTENHVVRFCPPIGSHHGIAGLLESRVLRHSEMYGINPKFLTVVLTGHGSGRDPGHARALRGHAAALETSGRFGWIRVAYLEEPPLVADTMANGRGHVMAVIGYLANEGGHAMNDLPELIAAEQSARGTSWPPVHDLGTIGGDEGMPGLIIDFVTRGD
jgi:sirohydrochlorin cobaltochelatase